MAVSPGALQLVGAIAVNEGHCCQRSAQRAT
jgi:hypothetical protein